MLSEIERLVSELNLSWYNDKKQFFEKETSYNKSLNKIDNVIPDVIFYGAENENFKEIDIVVDVDLITYCWDSSFPGSARDNIPDADYILPVDGRTVGFEIVRYIQSSTENFSDPKAIDVFILQVIDSVKQAIQKQIEKDSDEVYIGVLEMFVRNVRKEITKKFAHIRHQIELAHANEDKLEFNITQEQLAALLYILNKAGFFNTINYNDTSFLKFCQQYFYFKYGGGFKRPNNSKTFTDKYREFIREENSKSLKEVKNKLDATLKSL